MAKLRSKHFDETANSGLLLPLNGAFMCVYMHAAGVASYLLQAFFSQLFLEVCNCLRQAWDPIFIGANEGRQPESLWQVRYE